jgi:hypothetical protein
MHDPTASPLAGNLHRTTLPVDGNDWTSTPSGPIVGILERIR